MRPRPTFHTGFAPRDGQAMFPSLWDGCVGAWHPGIGPTGPRLWDWSRYKNHGTLTNMDAASDWVVGEHGYALELDGVDDKIVFPDSANLRVSSSFTFAFYIRRAGAQTNRYVMGRVVPASNQYAIIYGYVADTLEFFSANGGHSGTDPRPGSQITIADDDMHSVAYTSDGSRWRGYLDGIPVFDIARSFTLGTFLAPWRIGTSGSADYFAGSFSGVHIYNRALHANEIRTLALHPGIAYERRPRSRAAYLELLAAYRRRIQQSQLVGGGVI